MDKLPIFDGYDMAAASMYYSDNEDEDEAGYDAFNDETFGDFCGNDIDDWEEEHEKMLEELSRNKGPNRSNGSTSVQNDDMDLLSRQMAAAILNDDDCKSTPVRRQQPLQQQNQNPQLHQNSQLNQFPQHIQNLQQNQNSQQKPVSQFFNSLRINRHMELPSNITFVSDIEKNIKDNMKNPASCAPSIMDDNMVIGTNPLVVRAHRAEDIERELTKKKPAPSAPPSTLIGLLPSSVGLPPPPPPTSHINQIRNVMVAPPGILTPAQNPSMPMMNNMYAPPVSFIMPDNQQIMHHTMNQAIIRPVQIAQGAPTPPPLSNGVARMPAPNQQLYNRPQQSRVFYASSSRNTPHMHPPQLVNQNYYPGQDEWREYVNLDQPYDKYRGLMTEHEKSWLASIQIMQLNNTNPYVDDYYYTINNLRRTGVTGRGTFVNNTRSASSNRGPNRNSSPKTYIPQQFENSLGKLQVGSVTAPRKIIDVEFPTNVPSTCAERRSSTGTTIIKTKHLLLEIENMYNDLLRAEDYLNPISGVCKLEDPFKLINKIGQYLLSKNILVPMLAASKGKKLLCRILPYLNQETIAAIMANLVQNTVAVGRKDTDQVLLLILPHIRKWLATTEDLAVLNKMVCTATVTSLGYAFTNIFCISVYANLIERAEAVFDNSTEADQKKWFEYLKLFVNSVPENKPVERPVVGINPKTLRDFLMKAVEEMKDMEEKLSIVIRALGNSN